MIFGFGSVIPKHRLDLKKVYDELKQRESNQPLGSIIGVLRKATIDKNGNSKPSSQTMMRERFVVRGISVKTNKMSLWEAKSDIPNNMMQNVKKTLKDIFSLEDGDIDKLSGENKKYAQYIATAIDESINIDKNKVISDRDTGTKNFKEYAFDAGDFKAIVKKRGNDRLHVYRDVVKAEILKSLRESISKTSEKSDKIIISQNDMNQFVTSLGIAMDRKTYKSLERATKDSAPDENELRNKTIAALAKYFQIDDKTMTIINDTADDIPSLKTSKKATPRATILEGSWGVRDEQVQNVSKVLATIRIKLLSNRAKNEDGNDISDDDNRKIRKSLEGLEKIRHENRGDFITKARELIDYCQHHKIITNDKENEKSK